MQRGIMLALNMNYMKVLGVLHSTFYEKGKKMEASLIKRIQ
jgi:hypothetical protein